MFGTPMHVILDTIISSVVLGFTAMTIAKTLAKDYRRGTYRYTLGAIAFFGAGICAGKLGWRLGEALADYLDVGFIGYIYPLTFGSIAGVGAAYAVGLAFAKYVEKASWVMCHSCGSTFLKTPSDTFFCETCTSRMRGEQQD